MAATGSLSVSQAAWSAVIADSYCRNIRVTENRGVSGFPNGDFLICKTPSLDRIGVSTPPPVSPKTVRVQAGAQYTFNAPNGKFSPGQTAGFIQMINSVSTTFDKDEDQV